MERAGHLLWHSLLTFEWIPAHFVDHAVQGHRVVVAAALLVSHSEVRVKILAHMQGRGNAAVGRYVVIVRVHSRGDAVKGHDPGAVGGNLAQASLRRVYQVGAPAEREVVLVLQDSRHG